MLISGIWKADRDGVTRPYVRGEVRKPDDSWQELFFLVDSGADRTVLTAQALQELGFQPPPEVLALSGLGGQGAMVEISTALRFYREDQTAVTFNGAFAAMVAPSALDTSVLGRDLLNMFAVIIDRPANTVQLVRPPHRYSIQSD
jgi:Aspartyl protease